MSNSILNFSIRPHALRWLDLCTFGPKKNESVQLLNESTIKWFTEQIDMETSWHRLQTESQSGGVVQSSARVRSWLDIAFFKPDQLRQKVAYALSQVFVVSDKDKELNGRPSALANYYDILVKNAFGTYKDLLRDVTRSPVMGHYLTMVNNSKDNPDENYAREILQLFSCGLYEREIDHTLDGLEATYKLDSQGKYIPCYTEDDIRELARVFTGWVRDDESWYEPMIQIENEDVRDVGSKTLFNGTVVFDENNNRFDESENAENSQTDLEILLTTLENHPSTAINICFKLIQLLVTSNPSSGYLQRVVDVFNDGTDKLIELGYEAPAPGEEKGQLKAVIWAIVSDNEVYTAPPKYMSKIREPWLSLVYIYRALNVDVLPNVGAGDDQSNKKIEHDLLYLRTCNQYPLGSPSVFNFYLPDYQPTELLPSEYSDDGLVSPELQIIDWSHIISVQNHIFGMFNKNVTYGEGVVNPNTCLIPSNGAIYDTYRKLLFVDIGPFYNSVKVSDKISFVNAVSTRFFNSFMPKDLEKQLIDAFPRGDLSIQAHNWTQRLLALALSSPYFHVQQNLNSFSYRTTVPEAPGGSYVVCDS
ncbi:hypothetical protein GCE9029_00965 [Grimontia celer]|uniref:DUF1800 domain-containing protein n=1 Tax=Grimontia celer TaxID=1796497 RepID=A0A128EVN0_9GAMM|nr:DUF1800 family protein [Grimontia celer]CZF78638.1 hypothetical protein GCE9029_00965 [Grimontia celer]